MKTRGLGGFANHATANNKSEIIEIDIALIIPNELNFYSVERDVDKLVDEIRISHNLNPLEVYYNQSEDNYKLIAGHKRRKAITKLMETGEWQEWGFTRKIPCIVRGDIKPNKEYDLTETDVEMLNLIFSNKGQREYYTFEEKMNEIAYLEPIAQKVYQKKLADGKVEKGGFRPYFAKEWLGTSSSTLQRLKTINNGIDELKTLVNEQKISETVANQIALMNKDMQYKFLEMYNKEEIEASSKGILEFKNILSKQDNEKDINYDNIDSVVDDVQENKDDTENIEVDTQEDNTVEIKLAEDIQDNKINDYTDTEKEEYKEPRTIKENKEPKVVNKEQTETVDTTNYEIPEVPVSQDEEDPQKEAEQWLKQLKIAFYNQVIENAELEVQTVPTEKEKAQWEIRLSVAKYQKIKMEEE